MSLRTEFNFFVTVGRGTESFAAKEIMDKLTTRPDDINIRDGKIFFKLSLTSEADISELLALKSVERLFVEVTNYDNASYIQNKRSFLDKLMQTLSANESFSMAKIIISQLVSLEKNNSLNCNSASQLDNSASQLDNSSSQLDNCSSQLDNGSSQLDNGSSQLDNGSSQLDNSSSQLYNSSAQLYNSSAQLDNSSSQLDNTHINIPKSEVALNNDCIVVSSVSEPTDKNDLVVQLTDEFRPSEKTLNTFSYLDEEPVLKYRKVVTSKKALKAFRYSTEEPVIKYRKIDISCSIIENVSESVLEAEQNHTLCDSVHCSKEQSKSLCKADSIKEVKPCTEYMKQSIIDSLVDNREPNDNFCGKESVTSTAGIYGLKCNTKVPNRGQPESCHSKWSINSDNGTISFRVSVKCSGKVSRWINLKKLSRDLGWRVARVTGWRVDLRQPQFEVCIHITNDHVTVGIPFTRFPLSRRMYNMDSGLRAPVAWIMTQLCSIQPGDVVLDPMCGKATILIEASTHSRLLQDVWLMGSDNSSSLIEIAQQNVKTCQSKAISLLKADGLSKITIDFADYGGIQDCCLDVVVCDAPFNQKHLIAVSPKTFYYKFLQEIYRVLRPHGRCVLLTSEIFRQVVLLLVKGTSENHTHDQNNLVASSYLPNDVEPRGECLYKRDAVIPLTFVSSHYVKLGETHACIIVLHK